MGEAGSVLRVNDEIAIPEAEIEEHFVRASGPGGQNVNKVSTAVELRFNIAGTTSLPPPVRARLRRLAGRRVTKEGILVIRAETHRTQELNRAEARDRLVGLVRQALIQPKRRIPTRPTKASKERRIQGKLRRGEVKRMRSAKPAID